MAVRTLVDKVYNNDLCYVEIACLSTDTKPEGAFVNGSICTEVNTGKVYLFNESGTAGSKWVEQFSLQG